MMPPLGTSKFSDVVALKDEHPPSHCPNSLSEQPCETVTDSSIYQDSKAMVFVAERYRVSATTELGAGGIGG